MTSATILASSNVGKRPDTVVQLNYLFNQQKSVTYLGVSIYGVRDMTETVTMFSATEYKYQNNQRRWS